MFYEDIVLIGKCPTPSGETETRLKAIIRFCNEEKYKEFLEAQNKLHWLQSELGSGEWFFRDTYTDYRADYFKEMSDENQILKELLGAVVYIIE